MTRVRDEALTTAWELLDGTVCECGHVEGSHAFDGDAAECHGHDGTGCAFGCHEFRPVLFTIERAE